jgi:UDP-3-O-[3-hydroxymyristoyl] N-acetylglucosamine deacetylase / 3-hydroxyacyl-[acyl-carrier-protein] dehydratase
VSMEKQQTIASEASFSGIGLHTGNLTTLTFKPAPPDKGVTFYRVDMPGRPAIKADIDHVVDVSRGTTIGINGAKVHTVEHVLAAIAGLGIDNIDIEVDANEVPVGDGSSLPFMHTLKKAGLVQQDTARKYITIREPVYFKSDDVTLSVLPANETRLTMTIAYDHVAVGTQYASYSISPEIFEHEIAPSRTYCFLRDVKMLQEQGLIRGGSLENAVVIGDDHVLNDDLRFPDEFVRHKILDLLGDMFLLGHPFKGHVVAVKSGHPTHVEFSRRVKKSLLNGNGPLALSGNTAPARPPIDAQCIMKILPHRYPFLLVDRILSYIPHDRVVGIKNVTVDEPFFQGHWPRMPVMPGVLIIEVMAQISCVLVINDENPEPGKVAYFLGIESAKFRRSVIPGDQLIVESRMVKMRKNVCKVKAEARVDGELAAEATMLFMLRDAPIESSM